MISERTTNSDDPLFTLIDRITEAFVVQDALYLLINEDYFEKVCKTSKYFESIKDPAKDLHQGKRLKVFLEILCDSELYYKYGITCSGVSSIVWDQPVQDLLRDK